MSNLTQANGEQISNLQQALRRSGEASLTDAQLRVMQEKFAWQLKLQQTQQQRQPIMAGCM